MMTPKQEAALRLTQRITDYLAGGGLNNPELADHGAVRDLLIDCREALAEQPAQQQEPVAYLVYDFDAESQYLAFDEELGDMDGCEVTPLYTSPQPSKPWVGLTDEEVDECYYWKGRQWTTDELVRHVEAKLREKNNG